MQRSNLTSATGHTAPSVAISSDEVGIRFPLALTPQVGKWLIFGGLAALAAGTGIVLWTK